MSSDYLDHLDAAALGLLGEATGLTTRTEATRFFADTPHGIRLALAAPEADRLLESRELNTTNAHRLLRLAIAVHRTAAEICSAGWCAGDSSPLDIELLSFAGQGSNQAVMIDLLASFLPREIPDGVGVDLSPSTSPATAERFHELVALCNEVSETERAGALRLLGDEALFATGIKPARAASIAIDDEIIDALRTVLPRAVNDLFDELRPKMRSLLDAHLTCGPVWYRMAAQNLLHTGMRSALSDLSRDYALARRFLVRVSQGPLARLHDGVFADPS